MQRLVAAIIPLSAVGRAQFVSAPDTASVRPPNHLRYIAVPARILAGEVSALIIAVGFYLPLDWFANLTDTAQ